MRFLISGWSYPLVGVPVENQSLVVLEGEGHLLVARFVHLMDGVYRLFLPVHGVFA